MQLFDSREEDFPLPITAILNSEKPHYRVPVQMSEPLSYFLQGTLCMAIGALILQNLDALVRFDQHSGIKLKAWFKKQLGNSALNRELWSVGTPSGFRSSRVVFRIVGVLSLVGGTALMALSLRGLFH